MLERFQKLTKCWACPFSHVKRNCVHRYVMEGAVDFSVLLVKILTGHVMVIVVLAGHKHWSDLSSLCGIMWPLCMDIWWWLVVLISQDKVEELYYYLIRSWLPQIAVRRDGWLSKKWSCSVHDVHCCTAHEGIPKVDQKWIWGPILSKTEDIPVSMHCLEDPKGFFGLILWMSGSAHCTPSCVDPVNYHDIVK